MRSFRALLIEEVVALKSFRIFGCCSLLICCIVFLFSSSVSAHRGRTDSSGGHIDHSTGEYHYHHGHSAHQHTDLDGDGNPDCPYNFDDQTGTTSGSSSNGSSSSSVTSAQPEDKQRYTWWEIILLVAFCLLILPFGIIMFGVPIFLIALKLFSLFKNIFARIFKK